MTRARDLQAADLSENCFSTHYDVRLANTITVAIVSLMQLNGMTILVAIVFLLMRAILELGSRGRSRANGRY